MGRASEQTKFLTKQLTLFERYVDTVVQEWLDNEPWNPDDFAWDLRRFSVAMVSNVFDSAREDKEDGLSSYEVGMARAFDGRMLDKCNILNHICHKEKDLPEWIQAAKDERGEEFFQYDLTKYKKRIGRSARP